MIFKFKNGYKVVVDDTMKMPKDIVKSKALDAMRAVVNNKLHNMTVNDVPYVESELVEKLGWGDNNSITFDTVVDRLEAGQTVEALELLKQLKKELYEYLSSEEKTYEIISRFDGWGMAKDDLKKVQEELKMISDKLSEEEKEEYEFVLPKIADKLDEFFKKAKKGTYIHSGKRVDNKDSVEIADLGGKIKVESGIGKKAGIDIPSLSSTSNWANGKISDKEKKHILEIIADELEADVKDAEGRKLKLRKPVAVLENDFKIYSNFAPEFAKINLEDLGNKYKENLDKLKPLWGLGEKNVEVKKAEKEIEIPKIKKEVEISKVKEEVKSEEKSKPKEEKPKKVLTEEEKKENSVRTKADVDIRETIRIAKRLLETAANKRKISVNDVNDFIASIKKASAHDFGPSARYVNVNGVQGATVRDLYTATDKMYDLIIDTFGDGSEVYEKYDIVVDPIQGKIFESLKEAGIKAVDGFIEGK